MKLPSTFKKLAFRVFLSGFLAAVATCGWLLLNVSKLPDVAFLSDPGISFQVDVTDWQGLRLPFIVGPQNPDWVPLELIPKDLQNAVLSGEDFSFYSHRGVDWFELRESLLRNLRERRHARGASTITQQLAKNLFLSRDKTFKRKLQELVLARRMEKALTKDRILELYLNVVELGDMVYGVGAGGRRHFGKRPDELSLRESAFLAAMLPGPKVYDPDRHMDRVMNRSDHILGVMLKGRMITDDQYLAALVEVPFAGEPSDSDNHEQDPGSIVEITPGTQREAVLAEEKVPIVEQESLPMEEILNPGDGIIEVPITREQGKEPGM